MKGENTMIYAQRYVLRREAINNYGKLGPMPYVEFFMTESDDVFAEFNKRKKIKFERVPYSLQFEGIDPDELYSERIAWDRFTEKR